jgi:hypothetical protein
VFQIKDLMMDVLPGSGLFLGQNCRISATDGTQGRPACDGRSVKPTGTKPPVRRGEREEAPAPEPVCAASAAERERGPRRAAGLALLRQEMRSRLASFRP